MEGEAVYMENSGDITENLNQLNTNVQNLESMIKLLLVNSLIDSSSDIKNISTISEPVQHEMNRLGFDLGPVYNSTDVILQSIIVPNNVSFKDIRKIYDMFCLFVPEVEPVFQFSKLNGMRRKRLLEEEISFHVINKEFHAFSLKGK